jgi:hypothetical protein
MQLLLRKSGYNFHTTAEKEIVRNIKEKTCYVAFDPQKEEELLESEKSSKAVQFSYKLPDGNVIEVSNFNYIRDISFRQGFPSNFFEPTEHQAPMAELV